jgi:2-hydroxychromene-2-carboxylate isomerase
MATIEFWYEFASTYSYPAVMRIEKLATEAGVELRWRAFLLGPIFQTLGWNDSPFNIFGAKGRYMWRDLARVCEAERLPLKLPPAKFPQNGLKAARLALAGVREGWTPSFTRAVFAANYAEQKDISEEATLRAILSALRVGGACCSQHAGEQGCAQKADQGGGIARPVRRAVLHHRRRAVLGQRPA